MQLIDRDKLRSALENAIRSRDINRVYDRYFREGLIAAMLHLGNQPTIEERKHGHWFDPEDDDGRTAWHCSVCDYVVKTIGFYPNYNYCPCCGARMDKGVRKWVIIC